MLRIVRWLLMLLALAGVFVTAMPGLHGNTWWIRYLDFPRLEFMIAMAVVAFGFALLPRRTWPATVALLAIIGAIAYDFIVLIDYTRLQPKLELAAASCPEDHRLRLLEVNVQMTNRHDHRLLNIVRQADPDVAWFQETNAWWEQELAPLKQQMPHDVAEAQPNYFGVHLFSKLPLVDPEIHDLTASHNPSIFTGIRMPDGETVKLYAIHPRPPQVGQSTAERDAQLMAMALDARDDKQPHVVAGDMNSVPWEDVIWRTQRIGRFLDPRQGRGMFITWNAKNPVLKWPLDHILPGPRFELLSLRVLPAFGSDHFPYMAELCLKPAGVQQQQPPALHPDDVQTAQQSIQAGQHAANKSGYKGREDEDTSSSS